MATRDARRRWASRASLAAAVLLAPLAAEATEAIRLLIPGAPVTESLSPGETRSYRVRLAKGQFLRVEVDQRGVDVVLKVVDPGRRETTAIDRPTDAWGVETLSLIADTSGEHELIVRATTPQTASGRCEIRVTEIRAPKKGDREGIRAERMVVEAEGLDQKGDKRDAVALYEKAALEFGRLPDRRQQSVALYFSAIARTLLGERASALSVYLRAADAARESGDRALEAESLCAGGFYEASLGRPAEAAKELERALEVCPPDDPVLSAILNNTGYVAFLMGRHQKALESYQRSLPIARRAKQRTFEAWALFGFGLTYWALNEPEKSVRSYTDALKIFRERNNAYGEAVTLQSVAAVYFWLGAPRKALEAVEPSIAMSRAMGDLPGEALGLNNLGLAELALGRKESALDHLRKAYEIWRAAHDPRLVFAAFSLALVQDALGHAEAAFSAWQDAVSVCREFGNRWVESEALAGLARADLLRGNPESARSDAEASISLTEAIRKEVASESLRSTFLAQKQNAYGVLVDALLALHDREPRAGYASLAFAATERGRARSLIESLAEARLDLSQELSPDLRQREADLSGRIEALQKETAQGTGRHGSDDDLGRAEEEWDGLIAEIRKRSPRYASLTYPSPASLESVRLLVDSQSALVSYWISSSRVLVFLLQPRGYDVIPLSVSPSDLQERIEIYVSLISQHPGHHWRRLGTRLYGDLVAPWRSRLAKGVRKLVIVPDRALHSLPFESLPGPGPSGRYLIEDFAISYAPSATLLGQLGPPSIRASHPPPAAVLAFADPLTSAAGLSSSEGVVNGERFDTARLPQASSEARMVFGFGGPGSALRAGDQATARFARTAPLDRYGVIHFATHALLSQRVPSRSALVLGGDPGSGAVDGVAGDGLLRAREIYRLRLNCDLVVLSACQTARGRILPGEGVQSLARAFFHAGSRSLVASLWDVNDRRTKDLMEAFYERLSEGFSKRDALARAKRDLLLREPDLPPRFWAAFVLLGDGDGTIPLAPKPFLRRLFDSAYRFATPR